MHVHQTQVLLFGALISQCLFPRLGQWQVFGFFGDVIRTIDLGEGPSALAFGHGAVWVANDTEDSVVRIAPRTNSVVRAISVGSDPAGLAVGPDAIWVANSGDGTVSRIDPETNDHQDNPGRRTSGGGGGIGRLGLGRASVDRSSDRRDAAERQYTSTEMFRESPA